MQKIEKNWLTIKELKQIKLPVSLSLFFKKDSLLKSLLLKHIKKPKNILKFRNKIIGSLKSENNLEIKVISKLVIRFARYFKEDDEIFSLLQQNNLYKAMISLGKYSNKFFEIFNLFYQEQIDKLIFYCAKKDKKYLNRFLEYAKNNEKYHLIIKMMAYYPFLIFNIPEIEQNFNKDLSNFVKKSKFLTKKETKKIYINHKLFNAELNKNKFLLITKSNISEVSSWHKYLYLRKLIKNKRKESAIEILNEFINHPLINQSYKGAFIYFKRKLNKETACKVLLKAYGGEDTPIYADLKKFKKYFK
ncbi:hypothetical protein TUBRATIS_27580 [Tubulinosema ratisbonensis]|uniref:Uncharacterized protein n=1 Tax=Tubulinosema ratisbonensis TaxID=291195 RepID=A0A437AIA6_9MICR|nr:hypothetical protein TUBRATIS_27580 [Tubulinosema ratisbonensis]